MAYFIFLKYLRSLEGFRKNPHVKIPPKSPPTNFQSLGIFKNQILFRKEFFRHFGPSFSFRPSRGPPPFSFPNSAARSAQLATRRWRPARLPPPSRGDASSHAAFAPLHAQLTGGPHLSSLTSGSARAQTRRHRLPPLPAPPSSTPRNAAPSRYSPHHHSPLNSLPPPS
jgi:hypothetical protein